MPIDLDAPVIAVFGSNSTKPLALKLAELNAASLLGAAINRAGAILLTGAAPPSEGYPPPATVKDAAVHGAERAGAMACAAWVGVARTSDPDTPRQHGLRCFVVRPGGKDRRNLVEALISDAAIAVGCATPGTASEALFSLFVGRRLVVLSDDPTGVDASPRALSTKARIKVRPQGDLPAVDAGITAAYAWAEQSNERAEVRELVTDEASADALVAQLLTPDPRHAPRPRLDELVDKETWDVFVRESLQAAGRWQA